MARKTAEDRTLRSFYRSVLDEAELVEAMGIEGVDEEIAVLRVRLKQLLRERPEDLELLLKSVGLIVRGAATRYRMSAKSKDELASTMKTLIEQFAAEFFPERADA